MFVSHIAGLFTHPKKEWEAIHKSAESYLPHMLILAAIPPIAGYIGTTQFGWQIGAGDPIRLTNMSAGVIAIVYYVAMLMAVFTMGMVIHWMGRTYGTTQPLVQCLALASYTATPLFLIGIMEVYPVLWLNFIFGLPALGYTVYLLYSGVPAMMEIPEDRGFLFSSAVLAFGMVCFVGMLAATAIFWGLGLGPQFTS